jgi:hypothetical protein
VLLLFRLDPCSVFPVFSVVISALAIGHWPLIMARGARCDLSFALRDSRSPQPDRRAHSLHYALGYDPCPA